MDFGLSRVLGSESKLRTSDRRQFAGTLPYMSVEQLECREDLGPATDIYAFGVVLYEMLTRTLPFEADSLGAVLMRQLSERPKPPSHHVRGLSPALDRFVLTCLRSDPLLRYRDAGEALNALEAVGPWWRPRFARWLWKVAAPLAAATVVGGLLYVASERRPVPPDVAPKSAVEAAPVVEQVTRELGTAPSATPSTPPPSAPSPFADAPALIPKTTPPVGAEAPKPPPREASSRPRTASVAAPTSGGAPPTPHAETPSNAEPDRDPAARAAIPRDEAPPSASAPEAVRSDDDASWKPTRVPKRLRVPSPPPEQAR
jgi:serine/threonine protein kinase